MKYRSTYIGISISFIVISILGFSSIESKVVEPKADIENWGSTTPFVIDLRKSLCVKEPIDLVELSFYIHSFYGVYGNFDRTVYPSKINSAQTLSDFIERLPDGQIDTYESVWVKSLFGEEQISLMSTDDRLTEKQIALLQNAEIGDYIEVVIHYSSVDPLTKEIRHDRMDLGITVVPREEAYFPNGYDDLINYFEQKSRASFEAMEVYEFNTLSVKFTISEEGQVEEIHHAPNPVSQEIGDIIVELIQDMPDWTPAVDEHGNKVKQEFELVFGTIGC